MDLLNTNGGNPKIAKSTKSILGNDQVRIASLSMRPSDKRICPAQDLAMCKEPCLNTSGRGNMDSVQDSRQAKTDWWLSDPDSFLTKLRHEMHNFIKLCQRQSKKPVFRLNTVSDIPWENHLDIGGEFADAFFYDYTKLPHRIGRTPPNYKLMFSFSANAEFAKQVHEAINKDVPISVVFRHGLPSQFMGRVVIDGDKSDIDNVQSGPVIIGLRAKGKAVKDIDNPFIVDNPEAIAVGV